MLRLTRYFIVSLLAARTKLKKMILPLLLLLKFKTFVILPIVITVVGLIGIKGLGGAFLALLLSGAVTLKALLTPPPPPRVSYGVIKPHEIHHDHWHRSEQEVNSPYKGWAPEYNGEQYQYHEIPWKSTRSCHLFIYLFAVCSPINTRFILTWNKLYFSSKSYLCLITINNILRH